MDKFILDTWEDVDLTGKVMQVQCGKTGKVMQVQCGKCWKMTRSFFLLRRKSPMGSLIVDVECKKCHAPKNDRYSTHTFKIK